MDKEQLITELDKAVANGSTFSTEDLAKKALDLFPEDAIGHYYMAECCIMRWKYTEAYAHLNKALSIDPKNSRYRRRLAYTMAKDKKDEMASALDLYNVLLGENPEDIEVHYELGCLYSEKWKDTEAISHLDKVIEQDAARWEAYYIRSKCLFNSKKYDLALSDINKVIEAEPQRMDAYKQRIAIYEKQKNEDAILADYHKMIEVQPSSLNYSALADYYSNKEDYEAAEQNYSKALELDGDRPSMMSLGKRAESRIKLENYQGAFDDVSVVLETRKNDDKIWVLSADAKLGLGDQEGALEDLAKALETKPFMPWTIHQKRGEILMNRGDFEKAQIHFTEMANHNFSKRDGFYWLGVMNQRKGDLMAAYGNWQDAGTPEADEMIEKYCRPVLQEIESESEKTVLEEFESEFENNGESLFLQKIFGKYWKIDVDMTVDKSAQFKQVPKAMLKGILSMLGQMACSITAREFLFVNPTKGDIQAYYKVLEEGENYVKIFGRRRDKPDDTKTMTLSLTEEGNLKLSGLVGKDPNEAMYFKETSIEEMSEVDQEKMKQKMKEAALNFMGEAFKLVADAFTKNKDGGDSDKKENDK